MTEFGKTPLYTAEELKTAGVSLILYPLSAFRAMNAAALNVYQTLRQEGTQQGVVDTMQTRAELYDLINYHEYEQKLDELTDNQEYEQNPTRLTEAESIATVIRRQEEEDER